MFCMCHEQSAYNTFRIYLSSHRHHEYGQFRPNQQQPFNVEANTFYGRMNRKNTYDHICLKRKLWLHRVTYECPTHTRSYDSHCHSKKSVLFNSFNIIFSPATKYLLECTRMQPCCCSLSREKSHCTAIFSSHLMLFCNLSTPCYLLRFATIFKSTPIFVIAVDQQLW